jgi:TonB-linked SusC/RagA family outer membrane protein
MKNIKNMIKNKQISETLCRLTLAVFMCIIATSLLAQSVTITGKITDNSSKALPGVSVAIKGSTAGVVSDADGAYSINIPNRDVTLVFSLTGFATQEIRPGEQTSIDVSLNARARSSGSDYIIEGTVYDETGEPFEGVTLYVKEKTSFGAFSDSKGRFSIKASRGEIIVFSFVGYEKVQYPVTAEKKDLEIRLAEQMEALDDVIVVGLGGTQRKISSLAAISTIDAKELQVPTPSITNLLGGRVPGIITMQYSGEPGDNLAQFWIRGIGTFGAGSALVLIDGLEGDLNSIDPADVESFSVLKDAGATAVYGVRGANGVVIVTTKRGQEGKLNITGRANFSVSHVKRVPDYLRAYDYAMLANEAYEVRDEDPRYSPTELLIIQSGLDPDLYPDVSWQDEILNTTSFKHSYFASISGGGSIARYYASIGLSDETGAYKVEKSNPYASNSGYKTYSNRLNLDVNVTKSTVLYFGTDMFLGVTNRPGQVNTDYVWQSQARLTPLLVPVKYSNGLLPAGGSEGNLVSPYVQINHTGRHKNTDYRTMLTIALNQNLSAILEGLKIRVQGAYNRDGNVSETRSTMPELHIAQERSYLGTLKMRKMFNKQQVSYGKGISGYRKFHLESTLNYDHAFGWHRVSGLVYYYMSDQQSTDDMYSSLSAIPVRYQGLSSRLTYGYRDTYMMDINFGYTGSENFQPGRQFGFFPSLALGWSPTNYQWVKDKLPWITFFKIRGSIGSVGNDRLANASRFPYLTRISAGETTNPWGSRAVESITINSLGADNLMWEKALKRDIGIDARFFNDNLSFTVDFYDDFRDGIFQPRIQIPDYIGLTNNPYGNVGEMKSWGSDGNIAYTQKINKDMDFTIRANFTYAQNRVENWEELIITYPYLKRSGLPHNITRGFQCIGFFKDEDDIRYSATQSFGSTLMPGDLKYKDVNGDGKITDEYDQVPLSYNAMYPMVMYGFGGQFNYKNLSVGVLFRGTGKMDYYRNNYGYIPFHGGTTGNILVQFKDPATRWIPMDYALAHGIDPSLAENPNASLPRLQFGHNANNARTSDFWIGDARYLRLQEFTVNYHLGNNFLKKLGIASIDLMFVGNNLFVWDKVKVFDPEQADKNGEKYPIPAIYSLQMHIRL